MTTGTAPTTGRVLVVDEDKGLARRVKSLLATAEATAPEVLACVESDRLDEAMVDDGPFDVLVAGPSLADDSGLALLERIHRSWPTTYLVLAFDPAAVDVHAAIRCGASDVVQDPDDVPRLRAALAEALDVVEGWTGVAAPTLEAAPTESGRGRILTVCSATGGCGKTFFSTNLASHLARHSGGSVVLVDLDLQFGEVAASLRVRSDSALPDLLDSPLLRPESDDVADVGELEDHLTRTESGLWVLAAPRDPVDADRVKPIEVSRILDLLASRFDHVVVDTPTGLTELVLAALDVSERLFVLGALDVMSVRNLRVFIETLDRLSISAESVSLVLNKAEKGLGITVADVQRVFDDGFDAVVPYSREVPRSMNEGVPILESGPKSDVARVLNETFDPYLPAERREARAAGEEERSSWLRRIIRRRDHR